MPVKFVKEISITGTESTSSIVDKGYGSRVAIEFPAMSGTTMSFMVAHNSGDTFVPLHKEDGLVEVAITGSTVYSPSGDYLDALANVRCFQIVSDAAEPATRSIKVYLTPRFSGG